MNLVSRKNEYEADQYAAETSSSKDLQNALKQLSKDNLSNLTPHPAYVFFHHSHPPVSLRLQALEKFKT
jgi:STE24 endopeptidase